MRLGNVDNVHSEVPTCYIALTRNKLCCHANEMCEETVKYLSKHKWTAISRLGVRDLGRLGKSDLFLSYHTYNIDNIVFVERKYVLIQPLIWVPITC